MDPLGRGSGRAALSRPAPRVIVRPFFPKLRRTGRGCSRGSMLWSEAHMGARGLKVKEIRVQLRSAVSIQIVTGPSLTRLTAMSAPNSPLATGRPKLRRMFEK